MQFLYEGKHFLSVLRHRTLFAGYSFPPSRRREFDVQEKYRDRRASERAHARSLSSLSFFSRKPARIYTKRRELLSIRGTQSKRFAHESVLEPFFECARGG